MGKRSSETNKIATFLESRRFTKKLKEDQKTFKILSEGDLQSCVYYHIRTYLQKFPDWHLTNKLGMGKKEDSKKFPDLAIVHMKGKGKIVSPVFLIELKEDFKVFKTTRIKHDIKKLDKLAKKYENDVYQSYFIYSTVYKNNSSKEINKKIEDWIPSFSKKKGYIVPITINIVSDAKNTLSEMENFIPKMENLRKYRG